MRKTTVKTNYIDGINNSRVKMESEGGRYIITVIDKLGCRTTQKFDEWTNAMRYFDKVVYGI